MKILNVDDNDGSRYAKSRTLQRAGFTVCEAASREEALRLVSAEQPDLVLLDVQLPDINGFEVCRRIKCNPATAAVMVVQMSASFIEGQYRMRGMEEGADAYLTEPVQPEDLMATITGLRRLRQIEVELRETRDALEIRVHRRTTELQRAIRALRRQNTRPARSEKALQVSYQFLQSTLDALSSHVVILDEAGIILEVNASWRDFLATHGFTALFDSRGMKFVGFFPIVPGTDVASAQAVVMGTSAVLLRQRETFSCEYACQHDAEPGWFFVCVTRFNGPEGGRIVVVFENITEVKRAEETMRLQQEALYRSERLASMGAVLASVAHELNNPLAVAQMQLDLLAEEVHDSALQDQIAELQQVTERCTRIVRNFLTLARRNPPQRTPVQLNAVVQAVLQLPRALHRPPYTAGADPASVTRREPCLGWHQSQHRYARGRGGRGSDVALGLPRPKRRPGCGPSRACVACRSRATAHRESAGQCADKSPQRCQSLWPAHRGAPAHYRSGTRASAQHVQSDTPTRRLDDSLGSARCTSRDQPGNLCPLQ